MHGDGMKIQKNVDLAIIYFDESIRQSKNVISMYNLAHIFLYEDQSSEKLEKAIDLLIKSSNQGFIPSIELLCVALYKKYRNDIEKGIHELKNRINEKNIIFSRITKIIYKLNSNIFDEKYEEYKHLDFTFDLDKSVILSKYYYDEKLIKERRKQIKNISSEFYDGFGVEI